MKALSLIYIYNIVAMALAGHRLNTFMCVFIYVNNNNNNNNGNK